MVRALPVWGPTFTNVLWAKYRGCWNFRRPFNKKDTIKDAKAFVEQYGLTFPILLDEEGAVSTMYGAFTIPTTIFLNANGEIVKQYAGPMEEQFLKEVVSAIR